MLAESRQAGEALAPWNGGHFSRERPRHDHHCAWERPAIPSRSGTRPPCRHSSSAMGRFRCRRTSDVQTGRCHWIRRATRRSSRSVPGAIAAPTAGLHFTDELLAALQRAGVEVARLTLHVGPGTFLPVRCGDLEQACDGPRSGASIPANTAAAHPRGQSRRRSRGRGRNDDDTRARVGCVRTRRSSPAARAGPTASSCLATRSASSTPCSPTSTCRARRCCCWSAPSPAASAF